MEVILNMRTFLTATFAAVLAAAALAAQSNTLPERFTSFAIDMSNTAPRNNATALDITITAWTTDADRDQLKETLAKGQDVLLRALQKLPSVGFINAPGSLRYDLRFARQEPKPDGGRMIFLATDRYITAWEAVRRPRTIDYPFTLIQLDLDKDGRGVGKASIATKITQRADGTIELENFSSQPVRLNNVRRR